MASHADFLSSVPLFAPLSDAMREEVAARARAVEVAAGEWLFRQGDPADSLFVLMSGRLEVVVEDPDPAVIRVLARGSALGELALLVDSPRSASVRAARDSELLEVTRHDFTRLLRDEHEFAMALTRVLGHQLQASRVLADEPNPLPTVAAVVPIGSSALARRFGEQLVAALGRWGDAVLVGEQGAPDHDGAAAQQAYGPLVDSLERQHDRVVLVSEELAAGHPWTAFCLRQSDRVLALLDGAAGPPPADELTSLLGSDLVVVDHGSSPAGVHPWIEAIAPRSILRVRTAHGFETDVEAIARRLVGRSVGVVLSGGGARGFAHIGVLQALAESGVTVDRVGGCSMGAYIGGMLAMGAGPADMRARCTQEFVRNNPLDDYTVPVVSLLRGRKALAMLQRTFGERAIEELSREYFCVSCDLLSSELVEHRRGSLREAVGASMCLPGIVAPVPVEERLLVDGGVLNNLPVESMARTGDGPVIAVDVTAAFEAPTQRLVERERSAIRARLRRAVVGASADFDAPSMGIKETLFRTIVLGSVDTAEVAQRHAALTIRPATEGVGMLEFERLDDMIEVGRRAADAALEAAPDALSAQKRPELVSARR